MGILDYLILAGIAVGILVAVRHLKKKSGLWRLWWRL